MNFDRLLVITDGKKFEGEQAVLQAKNDQLEAKVTALEEEVAALHVHVSEQQAKSVALEEENSVVL